MKKNKSFSLHRILVPIDFSKNAHRALHHAIGLAIQFGARITLLHVVEPAIYPAEVAIIVTNHKQILGNSRKLLVKLEQKRIPDKSRGRTLVRVGRPDFEIAEVARKMKADLIVLTTHGYSGFKRILLGSTAEWVVRHAPCPVLTVRIR